MMTKNLWNSLFPLLFCIAGTLPLALADSPNEEPKQLAPGVMTSIRPFINYSETFQWSDIPEIAAEAEGDDDRSFDWAKNLYFSKEVWCLQFSFKPIRFAFVDFPNKEGKMDRKLVWYMVYSVTNTGQFVGSGVAQQAENKSNIMVREEEPAREEGNVPPLARAEEQGNRELGEVMPIDNSSVSPQEIELKANNLDGTYVIKDLDYINGTYQLKEVKEGETQKIKVKDKEETVRTYSLEPVSAPKPMEGNGSPLSKEEIREKGTVQFSPQFIMTSQNLTGPVDYQKGEDGLFRAGELERTQNTWNDQFLPLAFTQIAATEDPNQKFQTSISFPAVKIAPGETYWGIATWTDIDPRVNNFTIYISGLTNALRWTDDEEKAYNKDNTVPMTGRNVFRKVLKLNFFRPGDTDITPESKVYFGVPGQKASDWVYL